MSKSTPPTSKPVGTNESHPQERRARELVPGAFFVGLDELEAAHYWSPVKQTVVVIEDDETENLFPLAETPYSTLGDWRDHVFATRGWEFHHITDGETVVDDLARGVRR